MTPSPSTDALLAMRNETLASYGLNAEREALLHGSARDTHDTTLPFAVLETLPLTPDEGDQLTGAATFVKWCCDNAPVAWNALLASEVTALDESASADNNTIHINRPFGMHEELYTVRAGDMVVGLLWSGKYLTEPVPAELIERWAREWKVSPDDVAREIRTVPVFSTDVQKRHARMMNALRASTEWALSAQERYRESMGQVLDAERSSALGSLSTGVAHHFNNLLSVILGYSSFLLNRSEISEEANKALRQISEAAQKGRRLTEEILSFAGSEVERETACSVHEILNHALSLLETQTSGRVRIIRELAAGKDVVRAPRSILHQTVHNLLTNCIDSMPDGGELLIRTANTTSASEGEDLTTSSIRIEVMDSASMPACSPEGRAARTAKRNRLSRLHGMVNQLEGSATISQDGQHSNRAQIILPLDEEIVPVVEAPKARKRLAPSLIWIVDDDPIFCEMCERVLQEDGHEVSTLNSGPALHKMWEKSERPPNLLIIDFSMPDYNGLELCEWLKEKGSRAPVILVSGFSHNQPDINKALKMRKTYFLQKPFPVPELADIVTVALGETLLGV